jgi:hypothetical protein
MLRPCYWHVCLPHVVPQRPLYGVAVLAELTDDAGHVIANVSGHVTLPSSVVEFPLGGNGGVNAGGTMVAMIRLAASLTLIIVSAR